MGAATRAAAQDLDAAVPPARNESVPEVVSPPPGNPRFPLMDSLRALAALGVLLAHVTIFTQNVQRWSWGVIPGNLDIGVTVFFVLSGFLLYRPFFSAQMNAAPRVRTRDYARRRILRIVPAYWLALTALAIYPGIPGVFTGDWWRYYGFLQFYSYHTSIRGLGVAWTLCVEVAFYAALPVYAAVTGPLARRLEPAGRVRLQFAVLSGLAAISIALRVVDQGVVMQNSLLTHFYWFALGMGLAVGSVALHERIDPPRTLRLVIDRPAWCWLGAAAVYLLMCAVLTSAPQHLYYSVSQAFWQYVLSGAVAVLLVLPAVFGQHGGQWPRRVLGWRWLGWLGIISYGIYLWHATIATVLIEHDVQSWPSLLIADLVISVSVAAASYYVVERPLLRLKNRRLRPGTPPAPEARLASPPG